MKRLTIFFALLLLVVIFPACGKSDDTTESSVDENLMKVCEQDLIKSLDEMRSSAINKESYIYSSELLITGDTSNNDEINKKIASLVEYFVSKISVNENIAIANLKWQLQMYIK